MIISILNKRFYQNYKNCLIKLYECCSNNSYFYFNSNYNSVIISNKFNNYKI